MAELLSSHRYLCKKSMKLHAMENARARKCQKALIKNDALKRKIMDGHNKPQDRHGLVKKSKWSFSDQQHQCTSNSTNPSADVSKPGLFGSCGSRDSWEVDSGFCSEASPPASGRSSPCSLSGRVVALDCEMVGTGPGGRCSELARCSIVDYSGAVLYDKYVLPCQPVTDYRTRWSGIQRHHLYQATPFARAREEILSILEGKVIIGHSIINDFEALDMRHPSHMVRDTSTSRLLLRLAGLPHRQCSSLKALSLKLLNRQIQGRRKGHCSVQDAKATLDLYKLVEDEWEHELRAEGEDAPGSSSMNRYMQDEFWPEDVVCGGQ